MDKPALRERYCTLRECLSAGEVAAASETLCRLLASHLPALLEQTTQPTNYPTTLLTYLAFRNEPDLGLLFELLPAVCWAIPRISRERLALHVYEPDRLVRHSFGMLEPAPDAPPVDPAAIDAVLVPGVAFDRQGGRLGLGGGYYDRFLPTTPALRVGVIYDACLLDRLPCAAHDQRMDWIATPTRLLEVAPLDKPAERR